MLVKYHQIDAESTLVNKPFDEGSLYFCTDTKHIYFDPVGGTTRTLVGGDPIILSTEAERENILAPIPGKIYIVIQSKMIYTYTNGIWNSFFGEDNKSFIITATIVDNTGDDIICTTDRTLYEIGAALDSGKSVYFQLLLDQADDGVTIVRMPLSIIIGNSVVFSIQIGIDGYTAQVYSDNSATVQLIHITHDQIGALSSDVTTLPNPKALTINGVSYDGSVERSMKSNFYVTLSGVGTDSITANKTCAEIVIAHNAGYNVLAIDEYGNIYLPISISQSQCDFARSDFSSSIIFSIKSNGTVYSVDYDHEADLNYKMNRSNPVGTGSFSINRKADTTIGSYSIAIGHNNTASGKYSSALGDMTTASGIASFSEGQYCVASGDASHAEGNGSTASKRYSHAEGQQSQANGESSHAEGYMSISTGNNSHAEGENSQANGRGSHSEGDGTIAVGDYSHVQGKYNIADNDNKYAHIVGNGTNNDDRYRSNAHTVDWNGLGWFAGGLKIGGTGQDDEDAEEVAKKKNSIFYIVGNSTTAGIWTGTCDDIAEYYDGLSIVYKTNIAGATGTTLNINGLGAVAVVRNTTSAITTHYGAGSILILTYTVDSGGTAYWKTADYDSDTKTRSSNKSAAKMFIIGATTQSTSGQTTYSNSNCYIGTDNCLYSGGAKVTTATDVNSLIDAKLAAIGVAEEMSF